VIVILLIPVLPFVSLGESFEATVQSWFDPALPQSRFALLVVAVLAADVLLPVPSSFVNTLAGARLGIAGGTAVAWIGMTVGAVVAFGLARWLGARIAHRLASTDDLAAMERQTERFGPAIVVVTRALPVLAEAAVLLLGTMELAWRRFLPPLLLANLGLAAAYAVIGHYAREQHSLAVALIASVALPVLAATIARRWFSKRPLHHSD
jgi:uncharacterized membrane protein YdjX (TVP38/TMEM64 family)